MAVIVGHSQKYRRIANGGTRPQGFLLLGTTSIVLSQCYSSHALVREKSEPRMETDLPKLEQVIQYSLRRGSSKQKWTLILLIPLGAFHGLDSVGPSWSLLVPLTWSVRHTYKEDRPRSQTSIKIHCCRFMAVHQSWMEQLPDSTVHRTIWLLRSGGRRPRLC